MKVPSPSRMSVPFSREGLAYFRVQASPEAFGAGIGRALSGLSGAIEAGADARKSMNRFDMQKQLIAEQSFIQQDFAKKTQEAPLGAPDFVKMTDEEYTKRHQQLIADARKLGWDEETLQDFDLRLSQLRLNVQENGIRFTQDSVEQKILSDASQIGLDLSQLVGADPAELPGAEEQLREAIDAMPGYTAPQKEALFRKMQSDIRLEAGLSLARQNPEGVKSALGGEAAPGIEGIEGYLNAIRAQESSGDDTAKNPRSTATGRYQFIESTWNRIAKQYPEANLTPDGRTDPAQQERAIRILTRENQNYLGRAGITPTNANLYAAHFLGSAGAVRVLRAPDNGMLTDYIDPDAIAANPRLGKQNIRDMTVADFKAWTQRVVGRKGAPMGADGKTGDYVLDSLDAGQRERVYDEAGRTLTQQRTAARGDLEVTVSNAEAAYLSTGDYTGKQPTRADFDRAYEPQEAEQRWTAYQGTVETGAFIREMKTAPEAVIAERLAALKPLDTSSSTFAVEQATYERAQKAAAIVRQQRETDPAQYVVDSFDAVKNAPSRGEQFARMFDAYNQLGIPPANRMPFTKTAVEREKQAYDTLPPEQKVDYLVQLRHDLGGMFDNGLSQMAKNGMQVEAYLASMISRFPDGRRVAANVIRGLEVIKEDPARKPDQSQAAVEFDGALGTAINSLDPAAVNAMRKAAEALYVFEGGGPKVQEYSDIYERALREILGGDGENRDTGWFVGNSGDTTILPPGMTKDQFEGFVAGMTEDDLIANSAVGNGQRPVYNDGTPVPPEDIEAEGTFIRVGPSTYVIKMGSDNAPLMAEGGGYYKINIGPDTGEVSTGEALPYAPASGQTEGAVAIENVFGPAGTGWRGGNIDMAVNLADKAVSAGVPAEIVRNALDEVPLPRPRPRTPGNVLETYTVKRGDTLSSIARRYFGNTKPETIREIARANGLRNPNRIRVGQELRISAPPNAKAAKKEFDQLVRDIPKPRAKPGMEPEVDDRLRELREQVKVNAVKLLGLGVDEQVIATGLRRANIPQDEWPAELLGLLPEEDAVRQVEEDTENLVPRAADEPTGGSVDDRLTAVRLQVLQNGIKALGMGIPVSQVTDWFRRAGIPEEVWPDEVE